MVPWGLGFIRWATGTPLPNCHSYPSPIPPSWVSGNSCTHCREGDTEGWGAIDAGTDLAGVMGVGVGLTYLCLPTCVHSAPLA